MAVTVLPFTSIVRVFSHMPSAQVLNGAVVLRFWTTLVPLRSGFLTEHLITLNMGSGLPSPAQASSAVKLDKAAASNRCAKARNTQGRGGHTTTAISTTIPPLLLVRVRGRPSTIAADCGWDVLVPRLHAPAPGGLVP